MRGDLLRLQDVLGAITAIEPYVLLGREVFDSDPMVQVWFVRHLQIVGEASRALTPELKAAHPGIPWRDINGMRNIVVYDYHGLDIGTVWTVAESHLPVLKRQIGAILAEMRGGP